LQKMFPVADDLTGPKITQSNYDLENQLQAYLCKYDAPGMIVGIRAGNEKPLIFGLGKSDIQQNISMNRDICFKIGSITKTFITTIILQFVEEGLMTAPEVEKGNGYLKQGDNFWMYRRNTRTFQHINRDESIAGTDSKGQDFEYKKLTEMYQPATDASGNDKLSETQLGAIPVYKLEIIAKIEDVSYPKQVYWVQKDNYLPLKIQSYSLSGTLMQTSYYLQYTQIDGKYLWIKAMFIDEFEKGNKTVVEVKNISTNKIDNYIFSKAYLGNLSK